LNDEVDLMMGTFSKSLGSMGGFLAGPRHVIEYLKHKARCFIFTASLAPAVTGGVLKALQILRQEPERIEALWKNTRKMHAGFRSIGFNIGTTQTRYMATHTDEELDYVLETCERVARELGIFQDAAYTGETKRRKNGGYDLTLPEPEGAQVVREDSGGDSSTRPVLCAPVSGEHFQNL
jgi:8-amino-7-oxononanoate synthase